MKDFFSFLENVCSVFSNFISDAYSVDEDAEDEDDFMFSASGGGAHPPAGGAGAGAGFSGTETLGLDFPPPFDSGFPAVVYLPGGGWEPTPGLIPPDFPEMDQGLIPPDLSDCPQGCDGIPIEEAKPNIITRDAHRDERRSGAARASAAPVTSRVDAKSDFSLFKGGELIFGKSTFAKADFSPPKADKASAAQSASSLPKAGKVSSAPKATQMVKASAGVAAPVKSHSVSGYFPAAAVGLSEPKSLVTVDLYGPIPGPSVIDSIAAFKAGQAAFDSAQQPSLPSVVSMIKEADLSHVFLAGVAGGLALAVFKNPSVAMAAITGVMAFCSPPAYAISPYVISAQLNMLSMQNAASPASLSLSPVVAEGAPVFCAIPVAAQASTSISSGLAQGGPVCFAIAAASQVARGGYFDAFALGLAGGPSNCLTRVADAAMLAPGSFSHSNLPAGHITNALISGSGAPVTSRFGTVLLAPSSNTTGFHHRATGLDRTLGMRSDGSRSTEARGATAIGGVVATTAVHDRAVASIRSGNRPSDAIAILNRADARSAEAREAHADRSGSLNAFVVKSAGHTCIDRAAKDWSGKAGRSGETSAGYYSNATGFGGFLTWHAKSDGHSGSSGSKGWGGGGKSSGSASGSRSRETGSSRAGNR